MTRLPRRRFLAIGATALTGLVGWARPALARGPHPTPRPGITGEKVLVREQLGDHPKLIELFDQIREIPQIVDGIRCYCGCAEQPGIYSLLSCFEGDAMARACPMCQGQGRLSARLFKAGKTLDEIRVAIDARYG
jgi:hypothetical protein